VINRREMLRKSLGVTAGLAVALSLPGAPSPRRLLDRTAVLYDAMLPWAAAFVERLRERGIYARDTGRDVARLVYGPLSGWADDPDARLAGITRYADFVVASGIAAERRRPMTHALLGDGGGVRRFEIAALSHLPAAVRDTALAVMMASARCDRQPVFAWGIGARR
jgi:hypothetical protein